jgi:serine protease AprX
VGENCASDPLCLAVEAAWKKGIFVVCAAGNDGRLQQTQLPLLPNGGYGIGYGSVESPGNDPYVMTVGAMKSVDGNQVDDQVATYSSRGPSLFDFNLKPDIVAPGNLIIAQENAATSYLAATYPSQVDLPNSSYVLNGTGNSSQYFVLSGTSMASPVVAGAAALLLQQSPSLSPDTLKARLMISATKWANELGFGDPCTYGAGYLNIPAALNCPIVATTYAKSPSLSLDILGLVDINLLGNIWGTGLLSPADIYGQRAMWGSSSIADSRAMWGSGCWGDTSTQNYTIGGISLLPKSFVILGDK